MRIKMILLSLMPLLCAVITLAACDTIEPGLNLDADNVMKIEILFPTHPTLSTGEPVWIEFQNIFGETVGSYMDILNALEDEARISILIDFFNSLELTPSELFMNTARPPETFRIIYFDGSVEIIRYHFAALFHNNTFYRIENYGNAFEKTIELDNILYELTR